MTSEQEPTGPDQGFREWRFDADTWARYLRLCARRGAVTLTPAAAEWIAAMLSQAEPPGTGAFEIARGYRAGVERLGVQAIGT